jgi:hypothetical protein
LNYAHVVIGLMEGELQATVVPNWTPGSKERQLFFCSKPGEDLEGDVIIASENGVSPAIKIPLDFEVLKGLDDLLMMVAAFAYPETDGTTMEAAQSILREGFGGGSTCWNCSDDECVYLWEAAPESEDEMYGFFNAAESAQLAAAITGSHSSEIVVFALEIPDKDIGEWVTEDVSCENMARLFAWETPSMWLNEMISKGKVKISAQVGEGYKPAFRWFYLTGVTRDYLDLSEKEYQDLDIATKLISGHGGDIEMLLDGVVDCDWRPIDVNLKGVPQGLKSEY